jgi:O-antigen ligase
VRRTALGPHLAALPGLVPIALAVVWSADNGGYDAGTWYWGALVALATLAGVVVARGAATVRLSRSATFALAMFALYVAWSYVSIAWASSPGDALQGSNRALLYLIVFALTLSLPWTAEAALAAAVLFALAIGVIAIVILLRLAAADRVAALVIDGRLAAPTGYFNSTAALFTIEALVGTALAARRELPGLLRGVLIAFACAGLQLAVVAQSRGWLFTLPLVLLAAIALVRDRLRVAGAALLPIAAALIPVHRLLGVFDNYGIPAQLDHAARNAGRIAFLLCAAMLVVGTLIAWADGLVRRPPALSQRRRRQIGTALTALAVTAGCAGAVAATHGHPFRFVKRQWRGFSHPPQYSTSGSHFATVGSGRYDFWRVSLDATAAHPFGGLGQDNFADYYVRHRRTDEEPEWTHSLEMRLLAHTGIIGLGLFAAFLVLALMAALRVRRRAASSPARAAAGVALLPLVVWLLHGSVDWFWEMPALSGPALAFLAMAMALGRPARTADEPQTARYAIPAPLLLGVGGLALAGALVLFAFPYLSTRELAAAAGARQRNPVQALRDLVRAADLNPLSAEPGRIGGTISLEIGRFVEAERRFGQAIEREPGGWFAWFGTGLAASALGDNVQARHDLKVAASINSRQPAVREALARVDTTRPLTPAQALSLLVLAGG